MSCSGPRVSRLATNDPPPSSELSVSSSMHSLFMGWAVRRPPLRGKSHTRHLPCVVRTRPFAITRDPCAGKPEGHGRVRRAQPSRPARDLHWLTGEPPNTVSLANHDGGLPDSCCRLGSAFPHRELGSELCFDGARCTPTPAACGFGFSKVRAHQREHRRPCLRGKCSGPGLLVWI